MASIPGVGRDPDAVLRTRRALDQLSAILSDLLRDGEIGLDSSGHWTITGNAGQTLLAASVFGQKVSLPGPPIADPQAILSARVFGHKVSYGTVG